MTDSNVPVRDEVSTIIAHFRAALEDPSKPLALLVRFQVGEGKQAQVEAAFAKARAQTRTEPGVIAFDLNRATQGGPRFVVYERWKSLADLDAHLRTPYIAELRRALDAVIEGAPEFHVLLPAD